MRRRNPDGATPSVPRTPAVAGPARNRAWIDQALCAHVDPEIFFPYKGGSARPAKAVCARCPVKDPCLEEALAEGPGEDRVGIRGGLSERERRALRKATA